MAGSGPYLEARGTDTLPGHTLAVGAVLTATHLLAVHAVEPRDTRLVAVQTGPARTTLTLPRHGVAAEDRAGRTWP